MERIEYLKRLAENAKNNNLDSAYFYLKGVIAGIEIVESKDIPITSPSVIEFTFSLHEALIKAKTIRDSFNIIDDLLETFKQNQSLTIQEIAEANYVAAELKSKYAKQAM